LSVAAEKREGPHGCDDDRAEETEGDNDAGDGEEESPQHSRLFLGHIT